MLQDPAAMHKKGEEEGEEPGGNCGPQLRGNEGVLLHPGKGRELCLACLQPGNGKALIWIQLTFAWGASGAEWGRWSFDTVQ